MAAISQDEFKRPSWQTVVIFTLAFWLGASLLVDFVMMPGLYTAGMLTQPGFASAGYSIFWVFNRLELVGAALALTGSLVLLNTHYLPISRGRTAIILSLLLLAVALVDTYGLTPHMSALGMQLNLFEPASEVPTAMNQMHGSYWALEALKIASAAMLLSLCYRQSPAEAIS
ncbi:DUF4149 domain-containing protein [Microcoleus sp. FACHB-672]|uniref:DUF4149 domain-containing protein n=1 Tax=Microcoleus sp. FACHB-672 TaxID=2692825 RepID=UPI001686F621|nr:DUF4149 domain-containing protein [Microcoleus sp. FACHB-672]MBD2043880.1 DUF4149 domain-containing protein [Microcoleus sp. FACHB-672]